MTGLVFVAALPTAPPAWSHWPEGKRLARGGIACSGNVAGMARPGRSAGAPGATATAGGALAPPAGIHRYLMQQRIAAIGQDFDIRNERGQPVYKSTAKYGSSASL